MELSWRKQQTLAWESVPCSLPQLRILDSLGECVSRADRVGHVVLDKVPELLDKDSASHTRSALIVEVSAVYLSTSDI